MWDLGADDYLTKPFSPRELSARVRAVLRRVQPRKPAHPDDSRSTTWEIGEFLVDDKRRDVSSPAGVRPLSRIEFLVLRTLASSIGTVFSRERLIEEIYGHPGEAAPRTIDSHVRRLRAKMNEIGSDPIDTVRGLGYRLNDAAQHE